METELIYFQKEVTLQAYPRGFHIITATVISHLPEIAKIQSGILHLFLKHTSASISINENADPSVRNDFEMYFNQLVAEKNPHFTHTSEGSDDMPAHIKSSMLGCSVQIPITNGRLNLGTWQGIYLGEHRNRGGNRTLVATLSGNALVS